MNTAYLLLGSNIEPRTDYLKSALELLSLRLSIIHTSSVYETAAWQMPEGTPAFLNMVIQVDSTMPLTELFQFTQETEFRCHRTDKSKNTSRTLDIDILLFNNEIVNEQNLTIPHPRLHLRRFTLLPLCEIAGELKHPLLQVSYNSLLNQCTDICAVNLYAASL